MWLPQACPSTALAAQFAVRPDRMHAVLVPRMCSSECFLVCCPSVNEGLPGVCPAGFVVERAAGSSECRHSSAALSQPEYEHGSVFIRGLCSSPHQRVCAASPADRAGERGCWPVWCVLSLRCPWTGQPRPRKPKLAYLRLFLSQVVSMDASLACAAASCGPPPPATDGRPVASAASELCYRLDASLLQVGLSLSSAVSREQPRAGCHPPAPRAHGVPRRTRCQCEP
jgi:hypothetical protein